MIPRQPASATPPAAAVALSSRVLDAAVAGDMQAAAALVQEIDVMHGAAGQMTLLCFCCDALARFTLSRPLRRGEVIIPQWQREGSAEITPIDEVPPGIRWAGRLAAARMARDMEAFEALVRAVPDDVTWSRNVSALIVMTALTLRSLEAGRT